MEHPLFSERRNSLFFILIWAVISAAHFFVLKYFYDFGWRITLLDTGVTSLLFALFGIGIWFLIRYIDLEKHNLFTAGLNLAASLLASLGLWLFMVHFVLFNLDESSSYQVFLKNSLLVRGLEGLFIFTLISSIYLLLKYQFGLGLRLAEESDLKRSLVESRLKSLQAQVNPHFLFNSLNSINSQSLDDPKKAREMTVAMADFLRYSFKSEDLLLVPLKEELEQVQKYLSIEKVRFGARLEASFDIPAEAMNLKVPRMILQPLMENAIKYGVEERTEPTTVACSLKLEHGFAYLTVKNPSEAPPKSKGTGTGLPNLRERLRLQYGGQANLEYKRKDAIFEVTLTIPVSHEVPHN